MSNSDFTKFMIARGLKQLLETKSFTDITIGDIVRHCKMSRNTFYYHFKDKYDVINWIFTPKSHQSSETRLRLSGGAAACARCVITCRKTARST